MPTYLE